MALHFKTDPQKSKAVTTWEKRVFWLPQFREPMRGDLGAVLFRSEGECAVT